jgi:hypothetical protein
MTRTVTVSWFGRSEVLKKVFKGESVKEIVKSVKVAFPEITHWSSERYKNRRGTYIYGDNDSGKVVTVPDC